MLAGALALRSTVVPSRGHLWFNLALTGAVAWRIRRVQLTAADVGVARHQLRSGAAVAVTSFVVVGGVIVAAAATPWTSGFFEDDRADVTTASMVARVLVAIPLGTVLLEELAFRGLLLAQWRRVTTTTRAVAWAAAAFGAWHVVTAWNSSAGSTPARVAAVVGTVAVTAAAGVAFGVLRVRTDSLVPPAAVHLATNSVTFAAAWWLAR